MTDAFRREEQAYRGMRIGLFGGSFNPAHEGHAHVAETALKQLGLKKVWWLVTPQNPLKDARETAPLAARIASAKKFAHGRAMVVSDIESRWGTQFSYDLIRKLRAHYPGVRFVWILGTDNLINFHRWRRWKDLVATLPVAFVTRPGAMARARLSVMARRFAGARRMNAKGALAFAKAPAWTILSGPLDPHSSTALRAKR
ncbi:MAG: nicotinate-nucleotide adenylyltransferase [Alphaproteobacteria bacterium]